MVYNAKASFSDTVGRPCQDVFTSDGAGPTIDACSRSFDTKNNRERAKNLGLRMSYFPYI